MTRHIEDSLAILPPICRSYRREDRDATMNFGSSSCAEKLRLIDVGTGAGLPGLIFAIVCPGYVQFLIYLYFFLLLSSI